MVNMDKISEIKKKKPISIFLDIMLKKLLCKNKIPLDTRYENDKNKYFAAKNV